MVVLAMVIKSCISTNRFDRSALLFEVLQVRGTGDHSIETDVQPYNLKGFPMHAIDVVYCVSHEAQW
jgi:hypothetical protein